MSLAVDSGATCNKYRIIRAALTAALTAYGRHG